MKNRFFKKTETGKTIRMQIMFGYYLLAGVLIFLVAVSIIALRTLERSSARIVSYQNQQYKAQEAISAHYKWLEQLSESITLGTEFSGGLDPKTCTLGHWITDTGERIKNDPTMKQALESIIQPHEEIHLNVSEVISVAKSNKNTAYALYQEKFKPKIEQIGNNLNIISSRYQEIAKEMEADKQKLTLLINFLLFLISLFSLILALDIGRRVSKRISDPINAVADYSEKLAAGVDHLKFEDSICNNEQNSIEVRRMIECFQSMADGIKKNVSVIQRVAEGDLTAYVEIKSSEDSLGRNLYRLVQNNDSIFSNMLQVADSVAESATYIAQASQSLAQSSTEQADSVESLSATVTQANAIATENMKKSGYASSIIEEMKKEVLLGEEDMEALSNSVSDIRHSSQKIIGVMKAINDIAFQTNILALNAAVEAARAGNAGKGFAVVASEVRQLALKSSEAAEQSRVLIEDTIQKTGEGSRISEQTFKTFQQIVKTSDEIAKIVTEIDRASCDQQQHIAEINKDIHNVASIIVANAATSEETAASTQQMNSGAALIREAMKQFKLRKREAGKPYIPPEKQQDPDFIRQATENYQQALSAGRIKKQ